MDADTERELRWNLEQAQTGLVKEFQDHQKTKMLLESAKRNEKTLREHLRQAYVAIEALNEELRFKPK